MPSIGVLEHYQSPTDKPRSRVKRSAAKSWVRRAMAKWIIENVLVQRLALRSAQQIKVLPTPSHWSGKLPQAEIEQLKFTLPKDPNAVKRSQTLANQANSWCRANEKQREIMSQHIEASAY